MTCATRLATLADWRPGSSSAPALVRANLESLALLPLLDDALARLLRIHMVAAQRPVGSGATGYEAQRLAVGFVDLVGSTALATGLSARELSTALSEFESRGC